MVCRSDLVHVDARHPVLQLQWGRDTFTTFTTFTTFVGIPSHHFQLRQRYMWGWKHDEDKEHGLEPPRLGHSGLLPQLRVHRCQMEGSFGRAHVRILRLFSVEFGRKHQRKR
jgi:hypothetical protein